MEDFKNSEKVDTQLMHGVANENDSSELRLYLECFSIRRMPNHKTFEHCCIRNFVKMAHSSLSFTEALEHPSTEETILNMVNETSPQVQELLHVVYMRVHTQYGES